MKTRSILKFTAVFAIVGFISACSSNPKSTQLPDHIATPGQSADIVDTARGPSLTLDDVLFDFEQSSLRPEAQSTVVKAVSYLKANPQRRAIVEGHTDTTGDAQFNHMLSVKRSEAIKQAMLSQGIAERRIEVSGLGETQPVADNSTLSGRQANRRVEIIFALDGQGS